MLGVIDTKEQCHIESFIIMEDDLKTNEEVAIQLLRNMAKSSDLLEYLATFRLLTQYNLTPILLLEQ